jgi:hypothetical protein
VPLAGGTVETVIAGQSDPTVIAVDASSVYWASREDGNVYKLAK